MDSSWKNASSWYDTIVSEEGHYYHQKIVLPRSLALLNLRGGDALLDLACGQGILSRHIPKGVDYLGIDGSAGLIAAAKKRSKHRFLVHDLSLPFFCEQKFSHAAIILAFQNIFNPAETVATAAAHLKKRGKLLIVLNHPMFRIPRQTHWGIDEKRKLQYRMIDKYMTPMKIPIQTTPSKGGKSETVWSYHYSLSEICDMLRKGGFLIETIEEWVSDKKSVGKNAKMENAARKEFPLFMALLVEKR